MAILFQDGVDLYGTNAQKALEYGWDRQDSNCRCVEDVGRFGGDAFELSYNSNYWEAPVAGAPTTLFIFKAHRIHPTPSYSNHDEGFISVKNGTAVWCGRMECGNVDQKLRLYDANNTEVDVADDALVPGVWYAIQMKIVIHATAGSMEVWVNGVQVLLATSIDTVPSSGTAYPEMVRFGGVCHNGSGEYQDDLVIWDDQGAAFNDWTEGKDLRIDTLRPNADTAQEDFTPQGAGDQYVEVDDDPDYDGDTTYNESAASGDKDRLALTTLSGTPAAIYNVRTRVVAKKTNAGAALVKVGVYSGTTEDVSAAGLALGTDYGWATHDNEINPDDSLAWEVADIDALQVQYEHA